MPTEKPRVTFTIEETKLDQINQYRFDNKIKNQTQAILTLIEKGLADFEQMSDAPALNKKAPSKKDEADDIADVYRELDDHGKGAVKAILHFEHSATIAEKRQTGAPSRPELKVTKRSDGFIELRVYDQPAAAGLGNYLDDPDFHIEQYPANEIPEGTDFGIRVSGDSMSPDIRNGSTAFVQSRSTIEPGKIGIFLVNGEAFCKKLMVDKGKGQIRLVSLNSDYEDRIIEECDDFSTMGLVLGHWPK